MVDRNSLDSFNEDYEESGLSIADSMEQLPHNRKDEMELDERNKIYTNVLDNYSTYLKENLETNKLAKECYVYTMLAVFLLMFFLFGYISLFRNGNLEILSALISFLTATIVIPTKVVEYLFNPQESQQIGEIIKNIQTYDKIVRNDLLKDKNEKTKITKYEVEWEGQELSSKICQS